MWVACFNNDKEIKATAGALDSDHKLYEKSITPTGLCLYRAPKDSPLPHLVNLDSGSKNLAQQLQEFNKILFPKALISSGCVDYFAEELKSSVLIPAECLNSPSRLEVGIAPILYENISFDKEIQENLKKAIAKKFEVSTTNLFSASELLKKPEQVSWFERHLHISGMDNTSGALLIYAEALGLKTGCLKIPYQKKEALPLLGNAWKAFTDSL